LNSVFVFRRVYMYSSGTTGAPKCIVHGHGGTLINHLKEHQLQSNMKDGDILFYFTGKIFCTEKIKRKEPLSPRFFKKLFHG